MKKHLKLSISILVLILVSNYCFGSFEIFQFYFFAGSQKDRFEYPLKYSVFNLFDGIQTTMWMSSVYNDNVGPGIEFEKEIPVDRIMFYHGNFTMEDSFFRNARIKTILITVKNAKGKKAEITYQFDDKMEPQNVHLGKTFKVKYIKFTFVELYEGSESNYPCISEIMFYYKDQRYNFEDIEGKKQVYLEKFNISWEELKDVKYSGLNSNYVIEFKEDGRYVMEVKEEDLYSEKLIELQGPYEILDNKLFIFPEKIWIREYILDSRTPTKNLTSESRPKLSHVEKVRIYTQKYSLDKENYVDLFFNDFEVAGITFSCK